MGEILQTLGHYLSYPFIRYSLVVGILIALCSALLGVVLVLKRFSFIGDGLSHVAFGAIAIATALKATNQTALVLPITVAAAVILLRTGQNPKINGDAAIAVISVSALAIGYLLMNVTATSANVAGDVCSTLFGSNSILTLSESDVYLCLGMSFAVLLVFVLCYHRIFAVTFDENFSRASGLPVGAYNTLIACITAAIIVLAMNLVGSLLVSALIIFPALSSMRLFQSFRGVMTSSAVLAVGCALVGILISLLAATPVGATIVAVDLGVFLVCMGISRIKG